MSERMSAMLSICLILGIVIVGLVFLRLYLRSYSSIYQCIKSFYRCLFVSTFEAEGEFTTRSRARTVVPIDEAVVTGVNNPSEGQNESDLTSRTLYSQTYIVAQETKMTKLNLLSPRRLTKESCPHESNCAVEDPEQGTFRQHQLKPDIAVTPKHTPVHTPRSKQKTEPEQHSVSLENISFPSKNSKQRVNTDSHSHSNHDIESHSEQQPPQTIISPRIQREKSPFVSRRENAVKTPIFTCRDYDNCAATTTTVTVTSPAQSPRRNSSSCIGTSKPNPQAANKGKRSSLDSDFDRNSLLRDGYIVYTNLQHQEHYRERTNSLSPRCIEHNTNVITNPTIRL
jgi:hypothetical protein